MKQRHRCTQSGSTLIELLVASLIGVFLLYGALSVLLGSRLSYQFQQSASDVESRGHLALALMAEDIRAAAYSGCGADDASVLSAVPAIQQQAWSDQVLSGSEGSGLLPGEPLDLYGLSISNGSPLGVPVLASSDMILLGKALPYVMGIDSVTVAPPVLRLQADPATLSGFPDNTESDPSRVLLISDCVYNLAVRAVSFSPGGAVDLDASTDLGALSVLTAMDQPQAVMFDFMAYYLAIPSGRSRPSLYRKQIGSDGVSAPGVELVPGILNLQFLYGENIDSRPSADRYLSAADVEDWANVVSVRIYMLVESEEESSGGPGTGFTYFGVSYQPEDAGDRRIRRAFSTTVTLRNRMSGLALNAGQ